MQLVTSFNQPYSVFSRRRDTARLRRKGASPCGRNARFNPDEVPGRLRSSSRGVGDPRSALSRGPVRPTGATSCGWAARGDVSAEHLQRIG